MRLSKQQIDIIKAGTAEVFGEAAEVLVFGSRVDDTQRGGDIDLYIELPEMPEEQKQALESRLWIRLQRTLGEQKIDVVTHVQGTPMRPIDEQAHATGVRL